MSGLWGASSTNRQKPVWLTPEQAERCFATQSGWVLRHGPVEGVPGDGNTYDEILVAIGGLDTLLGAPSITHAKFKQKSLTSSSTKVDVILDFSEPVIVTTTGGTPSLVIANDDGSTTAVGNYTLVYNAASSQPESGRLVFTLDPAVFATGDTITLAGPAQAAIVLNGGTIVDKNNGVTAAILTFAALNTPDDAKTLLVG